MQTPQFVLFVSFWLHMLATILWLGGLVTISLWVIPSMRQTLTAKDYADWFTKLNQRLNALGWMSIGVLTVTGLIQMGANSNYTGLLSIANNWALALLLKHLAFLGMIAISAYITWGLSPALQNAAILRVTNGKSEQEKRLLASLRHLIRVNLFLGILTLAFTALARIS